MEKHYEIKKTINKIIREKKRFPSLQEMCNILHYTEKQTRKYMQALADDGYLEKAGDWYRYPKEPDGKFIYEKDSEENIITVEPKLTGTIDEETKGVWKDALENNPLPLLSEIIQKSEEQKAIDFAKKQFVEYTEEKEEQVDPITPELKESIDKEEPIPIIKKRFPLKLEKVTLKLKDILKKSKKQKPKKKEQKFSAPIYIIQILMGIIGIGASIISIYYTTVWLLEFLPWAFALLLSSIMVGFAVSAFETVILFLSGQVTRSAMAKYTITIGFIILWAMVTFFSIFSTIAGQYNKFVINLQEETKRGIDTGKLEWNSLQEQKTDLRNRLKEYRENVKTYTEISKTMIGLENRTENDKTWAENQYRLRKANEEVGRLLKELNKIREEEKIQIQKSKDKGIILGVTQDSKNVVNFYGWIARVLGIDKDRAQFFMSLLPAIFVDFISPIGISLALFLRGKEK